MIYLVFNTFENAYIANAVISLNMRLGADTTVQWSVPRQRNDGKFVIPKPDVVFMEYVSGATEEEFQESWFNTPTEG